MYPTQARSCKDVEQLTIASRLQALLKQLFSIEDSADRIRVTLRLEPTDNPGRCTPSLGDFDSLLVNLESSANVIGERVAQINSILGTIQN